MQMQTRFPGLRALAGSLTAALLLALPAAAASADSFVAQRPGKTVRLSVAASHGYRISVTNRGAKRRVVLTARKGSARAVYAVHGRATGDRIEGNFGALGRISVRFHPSSPETEQGRIRKNCEGRRTSVQAGRFVGTIRFDGEEGFSSVDVSSANGTVVSRHRVVCTESAQAKQSAAEKHISFIDKDFVAIVLDHDHSLFLETVNVSSPAEATPSGFTLGEVALTENRGRIKIGRAVEFGTEVDPVATSPLGVRPVTATIALPPPFVGTGNYVETPRSPPSWTGDLSVPLPGGGVVPLTGPEFTASLCHGPSLNDKVDDCEAVQLDQLFHGFRYPLF